MRLYRGSSLVSYRGIGALAMGLGALGNSYSEEEARRRQAAADAQNAQNVKPKKYQEPSRSYTPETAELVAIVKKHYPKADQKMISDIIQMSGQFPAFPPAEVVTVIAKSTAAYVAKGGKTLRPIVTMKFEEFPNEIIAVPWATTYNYGAKIPCSNQPMSDYLYERWEALTGHKYDWKAGCEIPKMTARQAFSLGAAIIVTGGLALNAVAAAGAATSAAGGATVGSGAAGAGGASAAGAAAGSSAAASSAAASSAATTAATTAATSGITEIVVTAAAQPLVSGAAVGTVGAGIAAGTIAATAIPPPSINVAAPTSPPAQPSAAPETALEEIVVTQSAIPPAPAIDAATVGAGMATGAIAVTAQPPALTEPTVEEIVVEESRIVEQPVSLEEAAATGLVSVGIQLPQISVTEPTLPEIDIQDGGLWNDVKTGLLDAVEQFGTDYVGSWLEDYLTDLLGRQPTQNEVIEWGDWIDAGADPNNAPRGNGGGLLGLSWGSWLLLAVMGVAAYEVASEGGKRRKRKRAGYVSRRV